MLQFIVCWKKNMREASLNFIRRMLDGITLIPWLHASFNELTWMGMDMATDAAAVSWHASTDCRRFGSMADTTTPLAELDLDETRRASATLSALCAE
jgi:hypothetical protein